MGHMKRMLDDEQQTHIGETADIDMAPDASMVEIIEDDEDDDDDAVANQGNDDQERIRQAVANATMPPLFRIANRGLEHGTVTETDAGEQITWQPVCSPIYIVGWARTPKSSEWGKVVVFTDPDGKAKEYIIPLRDLAGDCRTILGDLAAEGLQFAANSRAKGLFKDYLTLGNPQQRITHVDCTGWHGNVFLLGNQAIGDAAGQTISLKPGVRADENLKRRGSRKVWRKLMRLVRGNSRLILAVAAAFAAPLLRITGTEQGGFHFFGNSSTGKSTALILAGSVYGGGGPKGYVRQWKMTGNAQEGVLAMLNDLLVALDEISEADPRDVGQMIYSAANGSGKARLRPDGTLRLPKEWQVMIISSGECRASDIIKSAGQKVKAGQEIRLCEIPADAEAGMGIFQDIHGFAAPSLFAEHLQAGALANYGWAGPEFIHRVIAQKTMVLDYAAEVRQGFFADCVPSEADGQVKRVANRFALVAAAGELATFWGIVPWQPGDAMAAAAECFDFWLKQRGGTENAESIRGVEQVVRLLRIDGMRMFTEWDEEAVGGGATYNTKSSLWGWRRKLRDRETGEPIWEFFAHAEGFESLIQGGSRKQIVEALKTKGVLVPGKDEPSTVQLVPGVGRTRLYHLRLHTYDDGQPAS